MILSSRDKYLADVFLDYQDDSLWIRLIGKGYVLDGENGQRYLSVEMDIFDVFFRLGIIGTMLCFAPFLALLFVIMVMFFKKMVAGLLHVDVLGYMVALMLSLGIAFLAGHVLTAPAVSIYVALIAVLFYKHLRGYAYEDRESSWN